MTESRLVPAIDVASYQPADLTDLIATYQPEHVVVRLYLPWERVSQDHSRQQINSALKAGCTVGGYCWLYADASPTMTAREAVKLAATVALELPALWFDVETYIDGSIPDTESVEAAIQASRDLDVQPGIYSSATMWSRLRNPELGPEVWLWAASYDGVAELDLPEFGGMTLVGKQYSDRAPDGTSLDMSVFLEEATRSPV